MESRGDNHHTSAYVDVFACLCHRYTGAHRGQNSVSDPLDLELQGGVSSQAWMLETKLQSSEEQNAQFTAESSPQSPPPCLTLRSYLVNCAGDTSKVSIGLLTVLRTNAYLQLVQAFQNIYMGVDANSSPLI